MPCRTNDYPQGAIQSLCQIREILAAVWPYDPTEPTVTVFYVHGLGPSSFLSEYELGRNAELRQNHIGFFIETNTFDSRNSRSFALGDCNIGAHHNHHYLFTDRAMADAYLEYAKVNTPGIHYEPWDDYYD